MQKFLRGRIELVKRLSGSELPVEYADIVLILCSVLSACASWRWPGKGIDQKRFVELLIKSPNADKFKTSWVSVPCLIYDGKIDKNKTPLGKVANSLEEIASDKVDLSFEDAIRTYGDVVKDGVKSLKQYCYATLIYTHLRCGYSHEYFTNRPFFPPCPDEIDNSPILYRHRLFAAEKKIITIASFSINYLIELAEYHVANLSNGESDSPTWWIEYWPMSIDTLMACLSMRK